MAGSTSVFVFEICFLESHNGKIISGWVAGSVFCGFLRVVILIGGDSLRACNMDLKLAHSCAIKDSTSSLSGQQSWLITSWKSNFCPHERGLVNQIDWIATTNWGWSQGLKIPGCNIQSGKKRCNRDTAFPSAWLLLLSQRCGRFYSGWKCLFVDVEG